MINHQIPEVSIVILYQNDQYLMQLRDNIPHIAAPGCWGLFGGHLELGETPEVALVREIKEEIDYQLATFAKFGIYPDDNVTRHVFHAPLLTELSQLTLYEGWDMGLLTNQDIMAGSCYSHKAGQIRYLAHIHQKIMLDFIYS